MRDGPALRLTDGGMETFLIFHRGLELPLFASFPLLETEEGRAELRGYYEPFVALAAERGSDCRPRHADLAGEPRLGREARLLADASRGSTAMPSLFVRAQPGPLSVSGAIGPRDDGYGRRR